MESTREKASEVVLKKLVTRVLLDAGFVASTQSALDELGRVVELCRFISPTDYVDSTNMNTKVLEEMMRKTSDYANHASRSNAHARDLIVALKSHNCTVGDLMIAKEQSESWPRLDSDTILRLSNTTADEKAGGRAAHLPRRFGTEPLELQRDLQMVLGDSVKIPVLPYAPHHTPRLPAPHTYHQFHKPSTSSSSRTASSLPSHTVRTSLGKASSSEVLRQRNARRSLLQAKVEDRRAGERALENLIRDIEGRKSQDIQNTLPDGVRKTTASDSSTGIVHYRTSSFGPAR